MQEPATIRSADGSRQPAAKREETAGATRRRVWAWGLLAAASYVVLLLRWFNDPGKPTADGFLLRSRVVWPFLVVALGLCFAWLRTLGDRPRRMLAELRCAWDLDRRDLLLLAGIVALALAYQAPLYTHPTGAFDSDSVLTGLIAMHIADGRPAPAFVYEMAYGGTFSAHLLALLYAITGPSVVGLMLITRGFHLVFIFFEYAMLRTAGRFVATAAAIVLAVPPPALMTNLGYIEFPETLALAAAAVALLTARVAGRLTDDLWYGVAGVLIGISFWTQPVTLPVVGAACLTVLFFRRSRHALRAAGHVVCGVVIGVMPAFVGWGSDAGMFFSWLVGGDAGEQDAISVLESLRRLVTRGVLLVFGPDERAQARPAAGLLITLVIVAAVLWALARARRLSKRAQARDGRRSWRAVLLTALALGVLLHAATFVVSPFRDMVSPPRYLISWYVGVPALLALLLRSLPPRRSWGAALALAAMSAWAIVGVPRTLEWEAQAMTTHSNVVQSLEMLEAAGIRYCEAPYWDAYRVTFYSFERIVCNSSGVQRDPYYQEIILDHLVPGIDSTHLLARPGNSWLEDKFERLDDSDIPHHRLRTPEFDVLVFDTEQGSGA